VTASGPAPIANFTANPRSGVVPLTVQFTDTSTNSPTSWYWNFGDAYWENNYSQQNPIHTFYQAGTYAVRLEATNQNGKNSTTIYNCINVTANGPAPIANFTANPRSGVVPLTVQFTDTSTNSPTSWFWYFGDGYSSEKNPIHTFANAGTYSVRLEVTNQNGGNSTTRKNYITVYPVGPAPIVNFTTTPQSGSVPLTVKFTDTSTNSPTSWNWDFGDGGSSEQNPTHTFNQAGSFSVSLSAANQNGRTATTRKNYITVYPVGPATIANFTATPRSGAYPLTFQFTDTSINSPTSWIWTFGDGYSSNQNPVYTFNQAGSYTVYLSVANQNGRNSTTRQNYINVTPVGLAPVVNFTATPRSGDVPLTVQFTDTSINSPTSWDWYFGDGWSSEQNPTHTFNQAGSFSIYLSAANQNGRTATTRKNYINVTPVGLAPIANFTATPRSGDVPLTVQFTDNSPNPPTSWNWNFGDGGSWDDYSSEQNPIYTFNKAGSYSIYLSVANQNGRNSTTRSNFINVTAVEPSLHPDFTANVTSGLLPRTIQFTDTSTGVPTIWVWNFGDGTTATLQHPVHTYGKAGNHTVSLTASNDGGADTTVKEKYIIIYPKGDFNHNWKVDVGDVALVAYMVVNRAPSQIPDADFNANGVVDIGDAAKIAYFVVGKIPEL